MSIRLATYNNDKAIYICLTNEVKKDNCVVLRLSLSRLSVNTYNHRLYGLEYLDDYTYDYIEDSTNPLWKVYKSLISNINNENKYAYYGNAFYCILELFANEKYRNIILKFRKKYKFKKDECVIELLKKIQNINLD